MKWQELVVKVLFLMSTVSQLIFSSLAFGPKVIPTSFQSSWAPVQDLKAKCFILFFFILL